MPTEAEKLSDADYVRLADFRYVLRRFLEFSENAAIARGLTPQQHQALLVIRASPSGMPNISLLAERLRIRHNSAVELADRLENCGLIRRQTSPTDGRSVILKLTAKGTRKLENLSLAHRNELRQLKPEILGMLHTIEDQ
jgi:DNA-binding MarR family transcriptional regulator